MMVYERALYSAGLRGVMIDPKTEKSRLSGSSLSFENLLLSFTVPFSPISSNAADKRPLSPQPQSISPVVLPQCTLHNAGNNALMCLFAFQKLLEPAGTLVPSIKTRGPKPGIASGINSAAAAGGSMKINGGTPSPNMHYPGFAFAMATSNSMPRMPSAYDLASEFGQMQINMPRATFTSLGYSRPNDIKISKRTSVINLLGERGNLK